jgi:hypothetical protein
MEITGVNDFLQKCLSLQNRQKTRHTDNTLFFHGTTGDYKTLIPSIYTPKYNIDAEHRIFKETVSAFPEDMLSKKTTIEKLIFMRHYSLPNRLLDITKNPLISLFFSCYQETPVEREKDGFVHVFSVPHEEIKYCDSDSVCLVANISKRPADFSIKGIDHLDQKEFNEQDAIGYLVYEVQSDKPNFLFDKVKPETLKSVICLSPMMNNPRIINQAGYFFLFGVAGDKKDCAKIKDEWIVDKIRVSGAAKERILEELDFLNINEAFVYPDYEHLSKTLQVRYKKNKDQWRQAVFS